MKKTTVILICVILIASFAALVYYGLRHARGVPVIFEEKKRVTLEVPFIDTSIDLTKGVSSGVWDSVSREEIELMHQVMVLPWGKSLVSPITVKAFHNKKDIYFYISWKDETEDASLDIDTFSDACAIMFPMDEESQPSTLMMGFLGSANIWQWKASQNKEYWLTGYRHRDAGPEKKAYVDFYYPFEEEELFTVSKDVPQSAVNDLMAIRVGTITPKERQAISGKGIYGEGTWQVVFKRSLEVLDPEQDAVFNPGKKLTAFAVWNGSQGDRGGRKSISDWVELEIR